MAIAKSNDHQVQGLVCLLQQGAGFAGPPALPEEENSRSRQMAADLRPAPELSMSRKSQGKGQKIVATQSMSDCLALLHVGRRIPGHIHRLSHVGAGKVPQVGPPP